MLERMMQKYSEPQCRAKLLRWLWIISTAFTLFGFAVIFFLIFR